MSRVARRALAFAEDYGLHSSERSNLTQLEDEFIPVYDDLTPYDTLGFALFPPDGVVSLDRPAKVFIERTLSVNERRLVYAHEVGHYISGHIASPVTASLNSWQHQHDERQAWIAAAVLLIPFHALSNGHSAEEVAATAEVPVWIVELFRSALN